MTSSFVVALCAGAAGFLLARAGSVQLSARWAEAIPTSKHHAFIATAWTHNTSYICGFLAARFSPSGCAFIALACNFNYKTTHDGF
jgi:hypothetical protein